MFIVVYVKPILLISSAHRLMAVTSAWKTVGCVPIFADIRIFAFLPYMPTPVLDVVFDPSVYSVRPWAVLILFSFQSSRLGRRIWYDFCQMNVGRILSLGI